MELVGRKPGQREQSAGEVGADVVNALGQLVPVAGAELVGGIGDAAGQQIVDAGGAELLELLRFLLMEHL